MSGSTAAVLVFIFVHFCALFAAGHAVTYKRDSRSAATWVILIVFVPLVGTLLYFWIGINRVKRRARTLRRPRGGKKQGAVAPHGSHPAVAVSGRINSAPLTSGNRVELLVNGEAAYPRMLRAIREAKRSLTLATYIFDNDETGREFAAALVEAAGRGVEVRVLVDAVGARYSFPSIFRRLRGPKQLRSARFLDTIFPWRFHYSQLRNHRKILVRDGQQAFLGGMNIRQGHLVSRGGRDATQDLHFEVHGPVVADIQNVFADDWDFSTGERIAGEAWYSSAPAQGTTLARVLTDGPDQDLERLRWTLLGAISVAKHSVKILTPYFVPDQTLLQTLGLATLRGVQVEIMLPEHGNVFLAQWASRALLWQVLERGCRVYETPAPFDHSKLFLIDDEWAMVGSANWDARSLRLNFEIGLETQGAELLATLASQFALKRSGARELTLGMVDARPWWGRLRDGTARLFSPYL